MPSRFDDWHALPFRAIWVCDTEYYPGPGLANGGRDGDPITPLCLAAIELRSGRVVQSWQDQLGPFPPYRLDADSLFVAYLLTAEFGFHLAQGWGRPARAIDAYVEFRHLTNDARVKSGDRPKGFYSLIGASRYLRIDGLDVAHKADMRDRIIQGPPFSAADREEIQRYCLDDARNLVRVFTKLVPTIPSLPHALHRGEFEWALACQERRGIPIDTATFDQIKSHWNEIRSDLVTEADRPYGCYEIDAQGPHFRNHKFKAYLARERMQWPIRESGGLDMRGEAFRDMTMTYPQLGEVHELRKVLAQLRSNKLAVGRDGRNRTLLGPYGTKTGRNAPSNSRFIFGPAKCMRFLIRPPPGRALIYRDFNQQEFRIAAVKSRDPAMLEICQAPDVYLALAAQLGFDVNVPGVRGLFKVVVLGIQYGMEAESLALRAGISPYEAWEILARVRARFHVFQDYCAEVADCAGLNMALVSNFGWSMQCPPGTNPRTIRNFPIQSAGAEIMHTFCILAERRGIEIVAPVHDGFLAEGSAGDIDDVSRELDRAMRDASALVLEGYEISTDCGEALADAAGTRPETGPIRPGFRFYDAKGEGMWNLLIRLLADCKEQAA
jgi:DNA polymerase-1